MLNVLDLFSGIGGFSLGLEATGGFHTVAFCECEDYPRAVLNKHWPDVPVFDDVRTLSKDDIDKEIDVICGGFPCQPFSPAGKQRGTSDDRHLWPEVARLIGELRPTWFIGENSSNLVNMALDGVSADLEAQGYSVRAFSIPACGLAAHHKRERTWIVAHSDSPRLEGYAGDEGGRYKSRRNQTPTPRHVASCHFPHGENREWRWPPEPRVGRVVHGVPRRVDRLKALGNSVVPQIPYVIGQAILEAEKEYESNIH